MVRPRRGSVETEQARAAEGEFRRGIQRGARTHDNRAARDGDGAAAGVSGGRRAERQRAAAILGECTRGPGIAARDG